MPHDFRADGSPVSSSQLTPSERLERNTAMIAKIKHGQVELDLPIRLSAGDVIGSLKAVTWADASDPIALQRLTDWRNANMKSFLTQFTATPQRTAHWLREVALPNDGQMLFWVQSEDAIVGHLGFTSLTATDAQGDNAIRGERGGHPKLIVTAQHAMFQWLFDVCGLDSTQHYSRPRNLKPIQDVSSAASTPIVGDAGPVDDAHRLPIDQAPSEPKIFAHKGYEFVVGGSNDSAL